MARTQARARPLPGSTGWTGALVFAGASALAVLALYLSHTALSDFRFPVGPDGPVYTWLTRYADSAGFQDAPGGGPGVPGLAVVLGDLMRTGALPIITILGPALATACALAAAGLLESVLGPNRVRTAAAALLTGAFTAYLAGGWLANVAMVAVFLAALAALALAARSWRAAIGAAALLAAAALTHRVFLVIGLAIVGLAIALHAPRALRSRPPGATWWSLADIRRVAAAAAGAGVGLGLWAWISTGLRVPGDTSQDGFFRRLGLRDLLADRRRERLTGDATRAAIPVVTGLGLAAAAAPDRPRQAEGRFLFLVGVSWAVLTAGGIVVLSVTGWGPPNRLLQFAFFVPLAGAVGVAALAARGSTARVVAAVATVLFVAISIVGWFRQSPAFGPDTLQQAGIAGRAAATLPTGTPLVFVVDTDEPAAAYHVTQAWNVIRMGVPPERIPDVRVVVGLPVDVLTGTVTRTGDREHDRIAEAYLREASPLLPGAAVFVLQSTNPEGYERAAATATPLGPGVEAVQIPPGTASFESPGVAPEDDAGVGPLSQILLCLAAIVALAALGGGWASWMAPGAGPPAVVSLAPSAGIAVSVLGTVGLDRIGIGPGDFRGLAAVVVLAGLGYVAAVRAHRSERALTQG